MSEPTIGTGRPSVPPRPDRSITDDLSEVRAHLALSDDQLDQLIGWGVELEIEPGQELFRHGDRADFWWVLIDGAIDLMRHIGPENVVVGRMDVPGRWAGGFRAWDEQGVYLATGRVAVSGRVLRVPAEGLRKCADEWFPFGTHLIQGLYHTARSIEATARQRDSLLTLSTLAAGLAHELNNPAAAAVRAVDALAGVCDALLATLTSLAEHQVTAAEFTQLDNLRRGIAPLADVPGALELADAEDALSTWMSARGIERDWVIAPALAAAGVDAVWCDQVAAVMPQEALEPGLEWVANTLSAAALLSEAEVSTRRISALINSVKSYSQLDRGSLQELDVIDGLESTLVMLGRELGAGITVIRDYGSPPPRIVGYAAELNQVWTNLIDNAADAMAGTGTLRLTTRTDPDGAVTVEIADTGVGMSADVAARAFDAFFTTKDVGKGNGLGLDIARRIVEERHGGTIAVERIEQETVLRVRLPASPPRRR
jgi:signal transduction histidine kinase